MGEYTPFNSAPLPPTKNFLKDTLFLNTMYSSFDMGVGASCSTSVDLVIKDINNFTQPNELNSSDRISCFGHQYVE